MEMVPEGEVQWILEAMPEPAADLAQWRRLDHQMFLCWPQAGALRAPSEFPLTLACPLESAQIGEPGNNGKKSVDHSIHVKYRSFSHTS